MTIDELNTKYCEWKSPNVKDINRYSELNSESGVYMILLPNYLTNLNMK